MELHTTDLLDRDPVATFKAAREKGEYLVLLMPQQREADYPRIPHPWRYYADQIFEVDDHGEILRVIKDKFGTWSGPVDQSKAPPHTIIERAYWADATQVLTGATWLLIGLTVGSLLGWNLKG